jgi:23S rRNA pseudouridine1911/1915/1917 synthase
MMKYKLKRTATLLETIMEIYHGVSKQKAKQILSHSSFYLDGKKMDKHPKTMIPEGKEMEIINREKERPKSIIPTRNNPVSIYFEDQHLLVAIKPAGILSCENRDSKNEKSFHKILEAYILARQEKKQRLWVVHRLDKEVEGLILFAKTEAIQLEIKENWDKYTKKYLALTENRPPQEQGFIESWLKEGPKQVNISYPKEVEGSKFAKTEYQYLRKEKDFHLLEITLHTGRKNQIRVQLAQIGCPIVGDRKYGANDSVKRQVRLAACKLEFSHPVSGKNMLFEYQPHKKFFNPSLKEDENYKIV